ncbi:MAG: hypothetical protein WD186_07120 [Actinomycetota bacterium]
MQTTRDVTAVEMPPMERLEPIHTKGLQRVFGFLRVAMGWTFLWAFVDKLFGLGFATGRDAETGAIVFGSADAWVNGGSPTAGVLGFALKGPFKGFYETITGAQMGAAGPMAAGWVDWVFMLSMLGIGLALILGIGVRLAALGGIAWMAIFYTATAIWPDNNPILDNHIIEAGVLTGLFLANAGRYYGLGKAWQGLGFVKDRKYLY